MLNKNSLFTIILVSSALISCSSNYKRPESVDEKMKRYQAKSFSNNATPILPIIETKKHIGLLETSQKTTGRAPASVSVATKNDNESGDKEESFINVEQSHKRLYFLTLYSQYEQLQKFSQNYQASQMRVCPHFHSSLITHHESFQNSTTKSLKTRQYSMDLISKIKNDESYLSLYPELALPIEMNTQKPRVIDMVSISKSNAGQVEKLVEKAVTTHLTKAYSELSELCEFGSSDNYYIYENLMSSIDREGGLENNVYGLQILLKTSLMFNHALISSLGNEEASSVTTTRGRAPASAQNVSNKSTAPAQAYTDELMRRMKVDWAKTYYQKIQAQHP